MSESVQPWIRSHLISVAEKRGGNIAAMPLETKGKRVQIVEFLTFGSENEDSAIWALISDKSFVLPVKFSKEAVIACNKERGRRMTESRTALVLIKKFKPVSTRVPTAGRNQKMSVEAQLALYCESVSVVGSLGEPKWGTPKELESDAELREWSQGLRLDGGAGNVLKDRKDAQEVNTTNPPLPANRAPSPRKPPLVKMQASTSRIKEPMEAYNKRWSVCLISLRCLYVEFCIGQLEEPPSICQTTPGDTQEAIG
ncbi:hypothetical protein C8R44DRAFT_812915 [Mycena epipterygia]|nr:hypothetical protein C8R44DRAFT_812915 [Mycena epipterygia]